MFRLRKGFRPLCSSRPTQRFFLHSPTPRRAQSQRAKAENAGTRHQRLARAKRHRVAADVRTSPLA